MKHIIEKKDEEIISRRSNSVVEFLVNGKKLRVEVWEDSGDEFNQGDSDYTINEEDKKLLTEEELEVFEDNAIWDLVRMEDGEKLEVNGWD